MQNAHYFRACLNFIQHSFKSSFWGCFSVLMKSIAGYVTNRNRKTDRKEAWEEAEKTFWRKFKQALIHKVLRTGWLFVSVGIPSKMRFGSPNGGNPSIKIWLRYKIFQKFTLLWALQNLMFWKNVARVLMRVSLADFIQSFRLSVWQKPHVCLNSIWVAGIYSVLPQRLPL